MRTGLEKFLMKKKISEADFLERRVKEVKPHMDNLHSWLLEKKQAERSAKSWVMARRNFLFSGSEKGARASCFIKGLLQTLKTAKSNLPIRFYKNSLY